MGRKTKQSGLVQRGDIWYIRTTIRGVGRVRESTGTQDYDEACAYYQHRVKQVREAAIYGIRPRRTFREAARYYVQTCEKRSLGRDIQDLKIILPYIGELYLDEVHQGRLHPFIEARRKERVAAGTINRTLAVVRRVLHLAARLWRDEHNLTWLAEMPLIQLVKGPKRPGHPLTLEEQMRLLSALPRHLSEMALFGIHTGARQEEICGLRWEWYRKDQSYFALPGDTTKSGRCRPLILNSTARAIIEQRRGISPEYVFTYKGHRVLRMLNSAWKRARKEAGLLSVTVHDLRRTTGTRLRDASIEEWTVRDYLGHAGVSVTRLYAEPTIRRLLEAGEKLVHSPELVSLKLTQEKC